MISEFLKKRRFRVILSVLIAIAAFFMLTGRAGNINLSRERDS